MNADQVHDLCARALAAHYAHASGLVDQPNNVNIVKTPNGLEYVVLYNINGIISVYRVRPTGRLKKLRRWPVELTRIDAGMRESA